MSEHRRPDRPLPLDEVLGIVERRRRRRARTRAVAAPALSVAAVGVAGLVVVALQSGSDAPPALTPAALPPSPTVSARPVPPTTSAPPAGPVLPVDPGWLEADFLPVVAEYAVGDARLAADAEELARTWGIPEGPGAGAIVVKADWNAVPIDPTDPTGDDALADRFAEAGYTAASAAELARAWDTDTRTAEVMGGLLVEMGAFPPAG